MNKRLFYAAMQLAFSKDGATQPFIAAHGVQSVGLTTTFNLEPIFEIGQLNVYEYLEQIPEVEMTCEKVLDGYPLLYHLATNGATIGTLVGRQNITTEPAIGVFDDTGLSAGDPDAPNGGDPIAVVHCPRMVLNSFTYTFNVDGQFTESITLSGNIKLWKDTEGSDTLATFTGAFTDGLDKPKVKVQQRQDLLFTDYPGETSPSGVDENGATKAYTTVLPLDIYGVSNTGRNVVAADGTWTVPVQSITVSCDLNRTDVNQLGRKTYYIRYINFPVEIRTEIEVLATKWDGISASEAGGLNGAPAGSNLKNQTIRIQTAEGTRIDLGSRNKLQSVAMSGGDATSGGSNVVNRYSYVGQNYVLITHPEDPSFPPETP